jgi:hypothetical protein
MKQLEHNQYHVRGGFLVRNERPSDFAPAHARALDAYRRPFSPDEGEDPEDIIEVHNHIPLSGEPEAYYDRASAKDDEETQGEPSEGDVVARFPADKFHFATEGDEVVVYRGAGTPTTKTDIYDMGARDSRSRPPRTLRDMNAFNAAYYREKAGRR